MPVVYSHHAGQNGVQALCSFLNFESRFEALAGSAPHSLLFLHRHLHVGLQQAAGTFQSVFGNNSRSITFDLAPDVNLVRNERGDAGCQRLGHRYAEVFLM